MNCKKEVAVFISSGIGNAVLMVPALNLLKKKNKYKPVIILTSPFVTPEFLLFNNFPADEIIDLRNKNLILFGLKNINRFEKSYLDYSSSSIKNLIGASLFSKNVIAYRKNKLRFADIQYLSPQKNMHAAVLHAKMIDSSVSSKEFSTELLKLNIQDGGNTFFKESSKTKHKIVSVQISSGNNKAVYKNWPVEYWVIFLKKVIEYYKEFKLILLGDKNEMELGFEVEKRINNSNLINLIGKTDLIQASKVLYNSDLYIGLDSAFMHLAVAYDIPTFTILGASNESFIGYDQFDNNKHCVVFRSLSCRPCHTWPVANTSKTKSPSKCPDFACLTGLKPEMVFEKFKSYIK